MDTADMDRLEKQFQVAVNIFPKLPDSLLLTFCGQRRKLISLFKQATIGNVNTDRKGIYSIVEQMKWDSWKELEGMSADEAKQNYIKVLLEMCDKAGEQVPVDISECLSNLRL